MDRDQNVIQNLESPQVPCDPKVDKRLRRANFAMGLFMMMLTATMTWGVCLRDDEKTSAIFVALASIGALGFGYAMIEQINLITQQRKPNNKQR